MGAKRTLRRIAMDRAKGKRQSPVRALIGAAGAAAAAGGLTYKALRK